MSDSCEVYTIRKRPHYKDEPFYVKLVAYTECEGGPLEGQYHEVIEHSTAKNLDEAFDLIRQWEQRL